MTAAREEREKDMVMVDELVDVVELSECCISVSTGPKSKNRSCVDRYC